MQNEYDPIVITAMAVAYREHAGQFRKDGVTLYITHPLAVMELLKGKSAYTLAVAVLHDVLEDSKDIHIERKLTAEFNSTIMDALKAMTHYPDESYEEYLVAVKKNDIAKVVKIADICHNLSCSPSKKQVEKYLKALKFLFED